MKKEDINLRLRSFKFWLYENDGLGLRQVVNDILEPLRKPISEDEIKKHTVVADLLKSNGKIGEQEYQSFIDRVKKEKLIYTNSDGELDYNGSWDYVNKLNTNYSDIADILTELLIRSYTNGSLTSKNIIDSLLSKDSDEESKNILLKHKHKIPQLFETYLKSPIELFTFTENAKISSYYGETLENNIVKKLEELGYELIFQGGNGDFVDMLLSVDFIIKRNDKIYTAQAKTSDYQVNKFVNDYQKGKHRAVDLLIYPENAKYKIFMVKDKVTKEIDK
jgi:hypothetical protein